MESINEKPRVQIDLLNIELDSDTSKENSSSSSSASFNSS
jgi:hypothetical protein